MLARQELPEEQKVDHGSDRIAGQTEDRPSAQLARHQGLAGLECQLHAPTPAAAGKKSCQHVIGVAPAGATGADHRISFCCRDGHGHRERLEVVAVEPGIDGLRSMR